MSRERSGLARVAFASAIAGLIGYAITIVAARLLGADYAVFGVFWAALYFVVGALAGGQQEFARMTRPLSTVSRVEAGARHALIWFIAATAAIAAIAALAAGRFVFNDRTVSFSFALVVGLASYGAYAALLGTQYGVKRWWLVAAATVDDPLLRLVAILVVIQAGGGVIGAAWAAVIPFPILALLLAVAVRRTAGLTIPGRPRDSVLAALTVVGGGAAASFLINGVPVLFQIAAPDEDPAAVAGYVFAFILVRAPLVVGVLALQSFVIVAFRDQTNPRRSAILLVAGALGVSALGAAVLAFAGDEIVAAIAGELPSPSAAVMAGIAIASGTTASLVVTGCLALAEERRRSYSIGWWVAALAVIVAAYLVPGDAAARVTIATIAGPVIGMIVHIAGRSRRASSGQ